MGLSSLQQNNRLGFSARRLRGDGHLTVQEMKEFVQKNPGQQVGEVADKLDKFAAQKIENAIIARAPKNQRQL